MSVVVAYVPDSTGFFAVTEAAREARWRATDLIVVNVIVKAAYAKPTSADEQQIDAIATLLDEDGVDYSIEHVDQTANHPSDEILRIAHDHDAQLIVVGLKRRSAVAKALLGSNAQRVLIGAHCPVLSVWQPDDAPTP